MYGNIHENAHAYAKQSKAREHDEGEEELDGRQAKAEWKGWVDDRTHGLIDGHGWMDGWMITTPFFQFLHYPLYSTLLYHCYIFSPSNCS